MFNHFAADLVRPDRVSAEALHAKVVDETIFDRRSDVLADLGVGDVRRDEAQGDRKAVAGEGTKSRLIENALK